MGGRSRRWDELSGFVDVDGSTNGEATVRCRIPIDLLKSATHDSLRNGVREAEFTGAARFWLAVLRIREVPTADAFNIADLIIR